MKTTLSFTLKCLSVVSTILFLAGCAQTPDYSDEKLRRRNFQNGAKAAKADIGRGLLIFQDSQVEEEEGWQKLWCFKMLLTEKYGIQYHQNGWSPGIDGYAQGYQSVINPHIEQRLGPGWHARIWAEAEAFYRNHWPKVAARYKRDRDSGAW